MRKLLLTAFLMFPALSQANPWCLHRDAEMVCKYSSVEECYSVARKLGGSCRPNARELGTRGDRPYCLATATWRKCDFGSKRRCIAAMQELPYGTAGCVENTEKLLERAAGGRNAESLESFLGSAEDY